MWLLCENETALVNTKNIMSFYIRGNAIWVESNRNGYYEYRSYETYEEAQDELLNLFSMLNKKCS